MSLVTLASAISPARLRPKRAPAGGASPIFSDGFESGDLTHTENGMSYPVGVNVAVVTTEPQSGTYSLEFVFGPDAPGEDTRAEQRINGVPDLTEIWVRWWLYIPSGFTHRDDTGADNNKFFRLFTDVTGEFSLTMEFTPDGVTGKSHFKRFLSESWTAAEESNFPVGTSGKNDFIGTGNALVPGNWYEIGVYFKTASAAEVADGRVELWLSGADGSPALSLWHSLDWAFWAKGNVEAFVEKMYFLGHSNSGFLNETKFYVDGIEIWDAAPSWWSAS